MGSFYVHIKKFWSSIKLDNQYFMLYYVLDIESYQHYDKENGKGDWYFIIVHLEI